MENTINVTENQNQIQVFTNEQFGTVRTVEINGEPWFVAADVCRALEIANYTQAVQRLDDDERAMFNIGRQGDTNIVTESGLYSLVLGSRKPEAKAFKRWITHEVIPDIRKTGMYMTPETLQRALSDPRAMGEILIAYANEKEKSAQLKAQNEVLAVTIEEQKPAVEFTDHVANTKDVLDMRRFSLLAQKNGIDLGRNNMFKKLQELGYLDWNNVPYQKYIKAGYFKAIESVYKKGKSKHITVQTFITGKGQIYLIKKLRFVYGLSNDNVIDLVIDE